MKKRRAPRSPDTARRQALGVLVFAAGVAPLALLPLELTAAADPGESPEQETFRLAKMLRPIPDERWREIAGARINEQYDIAQGDNLWNISGRLFGDPRYWPKIWAMNNDAILNPHLIHPGVKIAFMPGTGTSLPGVRVDGAGTSPASASASPPPTASDTTPVTMETLAAVEGKRHPRSQEWKSLPPQSWEHLNVVNGPVLTEMKIENHLTKDSKPVLTLDSPALVAAHPLKNLGEIKAAPSRHELFEPGDHVLIEGAEGTTAGQVYSISQKPTPLKNGNGKVAGYAYRLLGRVKVLNHQDKYWDAVVISAQDAIQRGTFLLPEQPRIHPNAAPVPGPAKLYGIFMLDHVNTTYITAQHGFGFVDLGATDGVGVGMVLQSYQYDDPTEDKRVTSQDAFPLTNLQVVQVSDHFCTVMVISGHSEIAEGTQVKLLTDVSLLKQADQSHSTTGTVIDSGGDIPPAPDAQDTTVPPSADDGGASPPSTSAPAPAPDAGANGAPPPPAPPSATSAPPDTAPAPDSSPSSGAGQIPPPDASSKGDLPPVPGDAPPQKEPPTASAEPAAPPPPPPAAPQENFAPPPEEDPQLPKDAGKGAATPPSDSAGDPPDTAPDTEAPPPPVTGNETVPFPPDSSR